MSRSDSLRIRDMLDAIERILYYVQEMDYSDFVNDRKTQDAVSRNLEIIGEAGRTFSAEFRNEYSHIPWQEVIAMRNVIIHEYFGILPEIVWDVIQSELPGLQNQLKEVISTLPPDACDLV